MTLKLESTTNELWKGWNLAWYHHLAHIACVKNSRGLRQKLDALRVQTGPSPSKSEGFRTKSYLLWKVRNLACYHHFTHIACVQKLRGLRQKLHALRVQIGPSPSKYEGFRWKLICYKGISFFKLFSTPNFSCIQYAAFKATSSILNPF